MPCCGHILRGAAGLAKAALHVDRAAPEVIARRRAACQACDRALPCPRNPARRCWCGVCGCLLSAKTTLAGETCPKEMW